MREWGKLSIGSAPGAIPRAAANGLVAVARLARRQLLLAGPDRDAILVERDGMLHAGQVVGVLAAPGVSLEILPKIDGLDDGRTRLNLIRMLARTIGLKVASGELTRLGLQRHDFLELFISLFCERLFLAVHRGLPRRYISHNDDLRMLRGRLDIKRQLTTLAASPQRIASQYEDLDVNIPLNQIIKAAVQRLRKLSRVRENQRRLIELEFAFSDVSTVTFGSWHYESVVLDRTNTAWHDLLKLAKLFLDNAFQNTIVGADAGFALLFEMNTLFEKFIGRSLQQAMRDSTLSVTLQGPQSSALSNADGSNRRFTTKPDIVIHKDARPVLVIDTKWKRLAVESSNQGVAQADVYQMMAYGQVYNVKRLMLLYPHHRKLGPIGVQSDHLVAGFLEASLRIATVDLSHFESVLPQLTVLCDT